MCMPFAESCSEGLVCMSFALLIHPQVGGGLPRAAPIEPSGRLGQYTLLGAMADTLPGLKGMLARSLLTRKPQGPLTSWPLGNNPGTRYWLRGQDSGLPECWSSSCPGFSWPEAARARWAWGGPPSRHGHRQGAEVQWAENLGENANCVLPVLGLTPALPSRTSFHEQ